MSVGNPLNIDKKILTKAFMIMRKILLFIMLLSATSVFAQDVIVKKDGTTILSKVIEIGTTEVKYKKFSNQDGPTYTITKAELQAINYENGDKDTFNDTTPATTTETVPNLQNIFNYGDQVSEGIAAGNKLEKEKLLASAKSWETIGNVWFYITGLGGTIASALVLGDNWWIAGLGCIGVGLLGGYVFKSIANNKENAAYSISSVPVLKQDFQIGNSRLSAGVNLMNDKQRNDLALGMSLSLNF
jgi:hypothetical protein